MGRWRTCRPMIPRQNAGHDPSPVNFRITEKQR
jgi:hypothetical protein